MPFSSEKQKRFMFSKHPGIAKRWVSEAKVKGESVIDTAISKREKK